MSEAEMLAISVPAAPAAVHRCQILRRDGTGPCGRPLRDAESIARKAGPECWDRTHGRPVRPFARTAAPAATGPGPGQDTIPIPDTTPTSPCPGCWRPIPTVRGVYPDHGCPASGLTPAAARALAGTSGGQR